MRQVTAAENPDFKQALASCPKEIALHLTSVTLRKDSCLFWQGFDEHYVYFLLEGEIEAFTLSPDGKKHHFASVFPYSICGEFEVFTGGKTVTICQARQDCKLLKLEYPYFLSWLQQDWAFNLAFIRLLIYRTYDLTLGEAALSVKSIRLRVLEHLALQEKGIRISKETLSGNVMASRRSINRILAQKDVAQAVCSGRGWVEITDPVALTHLLAESDGR